MGADDAGLVDHILRQIAARTTPAALASELRAALDDEAEGFVMKLWRMVVFESERSRVLREEDDQRAR